MSRKAIGKTITRLSRSESNNDEKLSKKKNQFLSSVKFTNVTSVLLPGDDEATDFIEFTFAALKKLLKQHERNEIAATESAEELERLARKELRRVSAKLSKADAALKKSEEATQELRERLETIERVKLENEGEISELQKELEVRDADFNILKRNYDVLLKNIDDEAEPPPRSEGPKHNDWGSISARKPLPGSYGTGKRR
jgi:chromosome segregation ATPase